MKIIPHCVFSEEMTQSIEAALCRAFAVVQNLEEEDGLIVDITARKRLFFDRLQVNLSKIGNDADIESQWDNNGWGYYFITVKQSGREKQKHIIQAKQFDSAVNVIAAKKLPIYIKSHLISNPKKQLELPFDGNIASTEKEQVFYWILCFGEDKETGILFGILKLLDGDSDAVLQEIDLDVATRSIYNNSVMTKEDNLTAQEPKKDITLIQKEEEDNG